MKRTRRSIVALFMGVILLSGVGCTSANPSDTSTVLFDDVNALCQQDAVTFSMVPKVGGISPSELRFVTDIEQEIDDILGNYIYPADRSLVEPVFIDTIELGINHQNHGIYYLLDQINHGSTKLEDDASFDNRVDNPMIKTNELILYIDENDHIKVTGINGSTTPFDGIYHCEGIYDQIKQFESDQYVIYDLLTQYTVEMGSSH